MPAAPDPAPAGRGAIYRDTFGVPQLWADTVDDLAYVQGWEAAYERAWQLEYSRLRAEGRTAELLGAEAVEWDTFARRARITDTARRAYDRLDARTRSWCAAYVEGVNDALPLGAAASAEFAALDATPGRWRAWSPLAVFAGIHILFGTCQYKLWRAHVADTIGPDHVDLFGVEGGPEGGSNAYAVTGTHSPTGLPLVAGDPHRNLEAPNAYQQVRLACPEFDVVGLAFPGVPGVAHFGHAGSVAWATTNAMADYQDLYLEALGTEPDTGRPRARGPRGWEPVGRRVERIVVRGGRPGGSDPVPVEAAGAEPVEAAGAEPVEAAGGPTTGGPTTGGPTGARTIEVEAIEVEAIEVEAIETARGPVVLELADGRCYSLRTPSRVTASLGFEALLPLLHARDVEDVVAAMSAWVEPVNVLVIADITGRLREQVVGLVPERSAANRVLPANGADPAAAWTGSYARPAGRDRQLVVNGNDRASGAGLGYDYAQPERAARIRLLVERGAAFADGGLGTVSLDTEQPAAATLRRLLGERTLPGRLGPAAAEARDRLAQWDGRADATSRDAALFAAWRTAFVRWLLDQPALAPLATPSGLPGLFARWVDPAVRVGAAWEQLAGAADRLDLDVPSGIALALEQAAATSAADWGRTHSYRPLHPLNGRPGGPEIAAVALSGDYGCVLAARSQPGVTDACTFGPVARYLWDLADRDRSRWVVPLGSSARSDSPHRADQLDLWAGGETIPIDTAWPRLRLDRTLPPARSRPAAPAGRTDPESNR